MYRTLPLTSRELEKLNDERDHLAVMLSLEADKPHPDHAKLASMMDQLGSLEDQIAEAKARYTV